MDVLLAHALLFARLLGGILFYFLGFWSPVILPLSPESIYFIPRGYPTAYFGSASGLLIVGISNSGERVPGSFSGYALVHSASAQLVTRSFGGQYSITVNSLDSGP